jgi:hypothetical protein
LRRDSTVTRSPKGCRSAVRPWKHGRYNAALLPVAGAPIPPTVVCVVLAVVPSDIRTRPLNPAARDPNPITSSPSPIAVHPDRIRIADGSDRPLLILRRGHIARYNILARLINRNARIQRVEDCLAYRIGRANAAILVDASQQASGQNNEEQLLCHGEPLFLSLNDIASRNPFGCNLKKSFPCHQTGPLCAILQQVPWIRTSG